MQLIVPASATADKWCSRLPGGNNPDVPNERIGDCFAATRLAMTEPVYFGGVTFIKIWS
ncbi:MAG: hypothetical protein HY868_26700 [Chloroflexi bacterium]|nr:hypothetical protein [Chloroflexota bacterium]